jgi:hypothetical protein
MAQRNLDSVTCLTCDKVIATFEKDNMVPLPEDCYAAGNVPVPNCGWFCSQQCAIEFEKSRGVRFGRTMDGMIDYYRKENPSRGTFKLHRAYMP